MYIYKWISFFLYIKGLCVINLLEQQILLAIFLNGKKSRALRAFALMRIKLLTIITVINGCKKVAVAY